MAVTATDGALHAGRRALEEGRWSVAREHFARLLATGDALAPVARAGVLEGLAWAAWWLDDEPAVFAARGAAHRAFRDAGERRGAARTAVWLAIDELDFHGAVQVSAAWIARARRLLAGDRSCPESGWIDFQAGYLARLAGDPGQARRLGRRAAATGRALSVSDLEMLGLALDGLATVSGGHVREGLSRLDEATALALHEPPAIPISSAWTCCLLVSACASVRDYDRAEEWCGRIESHAHRYGSRYMLAFCRAEYGTVHLWHGRWQAAETVLSEAVHDFAASRPAWIDGPAVTLAELRRRQGRPGEAAELLERARPSPAALACRGRLAVDQGRLHEAVELGERALRRVPAAPSLDRCAPLELLVAARGAAGDRAGAGAAAAELAGLAAAAGTPALAASAARARATAAAAGGDLEDARRHFEDAIDGYARCHAPFEAAEARAGLAACIRALGRAEHARREQAAAAAALRGLGGPAAAARLERAGDCPAPRGDRLSPREREVLALVARGFTNQAIAERLVLSEHTVHRHVGNALVKLGVPTRAAAVARLAGLTPDD